MANARAERKVAAIARKLPRGIKLPRQFAGFVALVTNPKIPTRDVMNVVWSDPCPLLNADKSARQVFVPFLLFSDGGVVALWADGDALRVAFCDSEGQYGVLAQDFGDFTALMAKPGADLLERLELDAPLDTRTLAPGHKRRPVSASTQKALARWVASHALDAKTPQTAGTEQLRKRLHEVAARMLEDGLSKVYKPDSPHWSVNVRLNKGASKWAVTYVDYGVWRNLPSRYGVAAILPDLLAAMKTRQKAYELSINRDGRVYADGGNELTLQP